MATNFFTAAELSNLTNGVLDFYMKGDPIKQTLQDRPLYATMRARQSMFPGGRDRIAGNVKGDYTTEFVGYAYNDVVQYGNPTNLRQFSWEYFELHSGIGMTFTELKRAGITVVDSLSGERTSTKSNAAIMQITDILKDKLDDMTEGSTRSFVNIMLRDGTQSAKVFPGLPAIVRDNPTVGVVGGIDSASNPWWRNRALTGGNRIVHSPTNQTLTKRLRQEVRQLRRFGGRPNMWIAGSGFIERIENEVHEKGIYTQEGFVNNGATEVGMADISLRGVGRCMYEPALDDLGRTNFCYMLDLRHLMLKCMDGEDMKIHSPARPFNQYVLYRSMTWTGAMIANKLNCHGVYEVAP